VKGHVLLITYEFPPKGGPGVQRPLKTAKYLSRLGWSVTVLTVKDPMGGMMDGTLLGELPDDVRVERAWSLEPTRLVALLRRLRGGPRREHVRAAGSRGYTSLPRGAIRLIQAFFIPDEKVGWTPWAVRAAQRIHAREHVDVVVVSGPPFSAYGVAWRVARRLDVPWVADVRDPIVGGYFFKPLTPLHEWLMRRYERKVARSAARVVTATDGLSAGIASRLPGMMCPPVTITNGFDPDDFTGVAAMHREGFVLTYTGTFQGSVHADVLLEAIATLKTSGSPVIQDLRVRFVGPLDIHTPSAVTARGLGDIVSLPGYVSHAEAVTEMVGADVLLLVLGPDAASADIISAKLPEYLGAHKPVLALVPDGLAADVVRRSGAGQVVHPGDVAGTAAAIERLHTQWREGTLPVPDADVVAEFDRSELVTCYSRILEQVVEEGAG